MQHPCDSCGAEGNISESKSSLRCSPSPDSRRLCVDCYRAEFGQISGIDASKPDVHTSWAHLLASLQFCEAADWGEDMPWDDDARAAAARFIVSEQRVLEGEMPPALALYVRKHRR